MIDASARRVQESRLAARDLTLAIATFIWAGLLCASYDRLIPCRFSGLMSPEAALSCGPAGFLTGLSAGFFSPVCRFPRWPADGPWRADARQLPAGCPVRAG